ncbi:Eukaryotic translation initiation factor 2C [Perkinsus chesapeaki]|uniref:Eukaryotic translation initiation factor 2C n=1 Tax=Perkinsus chesapeaki TaxID=330153 RepID=A0A7J6L5E6_PERCH|nr:Eukaryotic translation initiation factor 2C [Perkinsus chesapeaki]
MSDGSTLSHTKLIGVVTRLLGPPVGESVRGDGSKVPVCRWLIDLASKSVFTTPAVSMPVTIDDEAESEGLVKLEARAPLYVTANLSRVVELFLLQTLLRSNPPLSASPRLANASKSGMVFVPVKSGGSATTEGAFEDILGARAEQRVVEGTSEGGAAKLTVTMRNGRLQLTSGCPLPNFIRQVCRLLREQQNLAADETSSAMPTEGEIEDFNRFLDTEVRVVRQSRREKDRSPRGLVVSCAHTGKNMCYTILRIRRCSEKLRIDDREMSLREYYEEYKLEGKKEWTCQLQQQRCEAGDDVVIVAEDWKGRLIPIELCNVEPGQLLSVKPLASAAEAPKASLSSVWLLRERLASSLPMPPRSRQQSAGGGSEGTVLSAPDLEIDVQRRPLAVKGRVLPEVTLEFKDKQKPMPCSQGSWVITGQEFKRCAKYEISYGVLEVGECRGTVAFCEGLRAIGEGHGLKLKEQPCAQLRLDDASLTEAADVQRLAEWCRGELPEKSPAILFVFFPKRSRRAYCTVKDSTDRVAGVASQVIVSPGTKRTINQWQSILYTIDDIPPSESPPSSLLAPGSAAAKSRGPQHGGVIAAIPRMTQQTSLFATPNGTGRGGGGGAVGDDKSLAPRGCMVMAFTLERSERVGGLWIATGVGSLDNDVNAYASASSVQSTSTRIVNIEDLAFRLLERFYIVNSRLPQRLLVFRNAFPAGRFLTLQTAEFRDLMHAISDRVTQAILLKSGAFGRCSEKMRDRFAREKYTPGLTLMSVCHGSSQNLTFWCEKPQDCDRKTGNVPAGMIVDGTITQPNILNFYLVSQQCHTGTARPTHYMCLHDDNYIDPSLRAEELQQIVWSLCHLSARCTRTTSRPAPLVYAEALAKRVDCYMEANNVDEAEEGNKLLQEDGLTDKLQGLNYFL